MSFNPSNETVNSGFIFKGRCRYLRTHIHLNKMLSNAASGQVYLILAGHISDKHLHVGDSKLMVLVRNSAVPMDRIRRCEPILAKGQHRFPDLVAAIPVPGSLVSVVLVLHC